MLNSMVEKHIENFLKENNFEIDSIEQMPLGGGDRIYHRVVSKGKSYILAESEDVKETKTFLAFTKTFSELSLPVPAIFGISNDAKLYIQQDLGKDSLLDIVLNHGYTDEVKTIYKTTLAALCKLQVLSHSQIDYSLCLVQPKFDKDYVLFDVNYFKNYFLSNVDINYDADALQLEFETIANAISHSQYNYFMYRDCQGRNIMIQKNTPYFIDYQGGMQGPIGYDVASLLWQAKAQLPIAWRKELVDFYIEELKNYLPAIDTQSFKSEYKLVLLIRLLQVLGAYGRRGLQEKKSHFITSIPPALDNLNEYLLENELLNYPELKKVMLQCIALKNSFE
jgi:aminoglycoside/choline kinase family phosphotransferase